MSESGRKKIGKLLSDALDLDEGEARIALNEEAVRLADLEGDLKLQYMAREQLIRAGVFGGATEKALVAFSWCLGQFDLAPDKFDQWALLWKYKWMLGLVRNFPQFSKTRLYEMIDDFAARSQRAGYGLRAAHNQRYRAELFWDDRAKATEYFHEMNRQPSDGLNNCVACERDDRVSFAIYSGNDEDAFELAKPLLNSKTECTSAPVRAHARILLPLLRLGRVIDAVHYHEKGYELAAINESHLDQIADHLIFLALMDFGRAVTVFAKHYPSMEKTRDPYDRFRFALASCLLFEMIAESAEEGGEESQSFLIGLRLPRSSPLFREDGRYDAANMAGWFKQKANELARRFDQRNETDFFCRTLADIPSLKALRKTFLLDVEG